MRHALHLIVEIGNTAVKAAWTEGEMTLGKTFRYQGERVIDFIVSLTSSERPEVMTVSSVHDISRSDEARLSAQCRHLLLLDPSHTDVLGQHGLPEYLTYDRAAGLIAARHLFAGKGCTVVDLGTTLTYDFLDADGSYAGGCISLGCRTRFKALNRYSKALPLLDTPADVPQTGDSVRSSIEAGIMKGMVFEIQGNIDAHPGNTIIFTGGDAIFFVNKIKNSIFVICNLVLMGLALITDEYVRKVHQ